MAVGIGRKRSRGVVSRPRLFERLEASARVTVVSAPAGSGKTVLLRSWLDAAGLTDRAAWLPVEPGEQDPQRFWSSLIVALRQTGPGSGLVRPVTAAPELDGWAVAEGLLKDLAPLRDQTWLVIDNVHELGSSDVSRQLELLLMRAPPQLRFVLVTRHDLRLGLHRVRLEGELTEFRATDLRFTLDEARDLLTGAGVELDESALGVLHGRTEGWAAGLRLAALSLTGHPDPEQFAAAFSGTERTVAEYLLAEVLERQTEDVRLLLLRTSVLERVSGPLADALTGGTSGERILQDLEKANAFVVSLDPSRSWFRYHPLFAGLLRLELRRTEPGEVTALHGAASRWYAEHGFMVEAIRHAEAAQDWGRASSLLADAWPGLYLGGHAATVHELVAGFPSDARATDAELAAVAAADELAQGSLEAAEQYLRMAARRLDAVPADRRGRVQWVLAIVGLLLARQRGNVPAALEEARRLQAAAEAPEPTEPRLSEELRALAMINLGIAEYSVAGFEEAALHLEQGIALAQRIGRPYLEFTGLAHQAAVRVNWSFSQAAESSSRAIQLAELHGWSDEPATGMACVMLGGALVIQGRPEDAEPCVQRAERTVRPDAEPAVAVAVHTVRGLLELGRGRNADALTAFDAAERLAGQLAAPHYLVPTARARRLQALIHLGELERADQDLAVLTEQDRSRGEIGVAMAELHLAQGDPRAATDALAPLLERSAPVVAQTWLAESLLVEAIARDDLGDSDAAERALEQALDVAEPDGMLWLLQFHAAPGVLARLARRRTAHASLVAHVLDLLGGTNPASAPVRAEQPLEPLTESEIRVLRYLPTNLSGPEIARELSVSPSTVKTHMHRLYGKLGTHGRSQAVGRARALALLAPSGARH